MTSATSASTSRSTTGSQASTHAAARSGGDFPWLPGCGANRQRSGVHQPRLHGMGAKPRHSPHPHPAWTAHAERLHRELQRQVPRRVLERPLVPDAAPGAHSDQAAGAWTTTRCVPTAASGALHRRSLLHYIAGEPLGGSAVRQQRLEKHRACRRTHQARRARARANSATDVVVSASTGAS